MKRTKDNNMLMHALILATVLATAKSAEAEITMEAAFQGHCGHTSPCEQLCFEIHDGMYECDCIEGYELNKNGYSCQVINSTSSAGDAHSKSDEDVLYQKGASFSAKLANNNNNNHNNNNPSASSSQAYNSAASASFYELGGSSLSSYSGSSLASGSAEDVGGGEDINAVDNYFAASVDAYDLQDPMSSLQQDDQQQQQLQRAQQQKVNSNDYYISSESISFSNEQQELDAPPPNGGGHSGPDVPENEAVDPAFLVNQVNLRPLVVGSTTATTTNAPTFVPVRLWASNTQAIQNDNTPQAVEEDYYAKQEDMSIYDDVNNNQLNLRPLSRAHNTYQPRPQNLNTPTQTLPKPANSQDSRASISTKQLSLNHNEAGRVPSTATAVSQVIGSNTARNGAIPTKSLSENTNISKNNIVGSTEACSLSCGPDGVCENSGGAGAAAAPRCLCPFGKTGSNCMEDLKVRVPKFSKNSWLAFPALRGAYKHVQIRVEFRPESFDGIILLSGERDDLTGDFMALLLNKGFVEFWFDCGSGVGSVRSRETILLNEWNSVIIYRHRWDAWLVLNHGTKVQGRSNGLFSRITFREPVFLGGTGNITGLAKRLPVFSGFVGCIRRFVANEHEYKFEEHPLGDVSKGFDIQDCVTDKCFKYPCQHGGKCLPSDQGAVCLCPIGFVGDLCEIRMDLQVPAFNGSSFLRYAPLGDSALIWLELKVILKPEQSEGLILYSGPEKHGDFVALSLCDGFVEFTFDLGSGPAVVRSEYPLSIGQWHTIQISRTARLAVLKIDELPEVMTISSNGFWHLSLPENLFVGGVNHVDRLPLDLKYKPFFVGCIQKIDINGRSLATISEALGGTNIGNCPHACVARPCGPLAECVPQMEGYECRCSALNAQCNKAAEVPPEELQLYQRAREQQHKPKLEKKAAERQKAQNSKINEPKHFATAKQQHDLKGKKLQVHKRTKLFGKASPPTPNQQHSGLGQAHSASTTASATISTTTTTTASPKQDVFDEAYLQIRMEDEAGGNIQLSEEEEEDSNEDVEDDIIFRDVHGTHKKHGHNFKVPQHNGDKQHKHHGSHHSSSHSLKYDPYEKHPPIIVSKLSRLPTHYESFHTNPDGDILTFEEPVEVDVQAKQTSREDMLAQESVETMGDNGEDAFELTDTLIDDNDGTQEYHRKQLAQDMHRIMANAHTPRTTQPPVAPQVVLSEYVASNDYLQDHASSKETKAADEEDEEDEDIGKDTKQKDPQDVVVDEEEYQYSEDSADDDDLLEPVQEMKEQETATAPALPPRATTPQTQTDWSLLKKLDLSADHQTQLIGVRKNFGACFAGHDSYFHYNDAETMSQIISYSIDLNLRIKTHSHDGVILWTGQQGINEGDGDFLSLGIENGYLHFRYDLGSGEVDIKFNTTKVSDGLWHRVRAIRNSQEGYLEVDGRKTGTQHSPGKLRQLNTDTGLYVGGLPELSYFISRNWKYTSGIVGCISEIVLAGELKLNFDANTLGRAHNVETGIL